MRVRLCAVLGLLLACTLSACGVTLPASPPLTLREVKARLLTPAEVGASWVIDKDNTPGAGASASTTTTPGKSLSVCSSQFSAGQLFPGVHADVAFKPPDRAGSMSSGSSSSSFSSLLTLVSAQESIGTGTVAQVHDAYANAVNALRSCRDVTDKTGVKSGSIVPVGLKSYGERSQTFQITAFALFVTIHFDLIIARRGNVLLLVIYGGSTAPTERTVESFADKAAAKAFDLPLAVAASGTTAPPTTADPLIAQCASLTGGPSAPSDSSSGASTTTTTVPPLPPALRGRLLTPTDIAAKGWEVVPPESDSGPPDPTNAVILAMPESGEVNLDQTTTDFTSSAASPGTIDEALGRADDVPGAQTAYRSAAKAVGDFAAQFRRCGDDPNVALPFQFDVRPSSTSLAGDESRVWTLTATTSLLSGFDTKITAPTVIHGSIGLVRKGRFVMLVTVSASASVPTVQSIAAKALAKL